jgi:hypothetical protein
VEAFEKWPGSKDPKETAASVWKGGETTWFEEVSRPEGGMGRFRDAMKVIGSGEGWETNYLAEIFPWGNFGNGTVVDVSSSWIEYLEAERLIFLRLVEQMAMPAFQSGKLSLP